MIFIVVVDCTSWLIGLAWISNLRLRGWGSNWASFVKIKRNKGLIAWFYLSRALINKGTTEHSELDNIGPSTDGLSFGPSRDLDLSDELSKH